MMDEIAAARAVAMEGSVRASFIILIASLLGPTWVESTPHRAWPKACCIGPTKPGPLRFPSGMLVVPCCCWWGLVRSNVIVGNGAEAEIVARLGRPGRVVG